MTVVSVALGLIAIACFWWAGGSREIGLKTTVVGGLGLMFMLGSILTTPSIVGHETCTRYSPWAEEC